MTINRQFLLTEMDAAYRRGDWQHCEFLIEDMYALLDVEFAAGGRTAPQRALDRPKTDRATPSGEMAMSVD